MNENREDLLVKPINIEIARKTVEERTNKKVIQIRYLGGGSFSAFFIKNEKNESFVAKFPKMADEVVHKMHYEKKVTDLIQQYVLPHKIVHQIDYFEQGSSSFAYPIATYKYFHGEQIEKLQLTWENDSKKVEKLAELLGDFNSKLHRIEYSKFKEFKELHEIQSSVEIKKSWFQSYESNKQNVFPILTDKEKKWSQGMFESFLEKIDKINAEPVLCHGDFDDSNILISGTFDKLQVIDFEEICIGDPVTDFCSWLDPQYGEKFVKIMIENYTGCVDEYFFERTKFYYDRLPFIYFNFGVEKGDLNFIKWGRNLLHERMGIDSILVSDF